MGRERRGRERGEKRRLEKGEGNLVGKKRMMERDNRKKIVEKKTGEKKEEKKQWEGSVWKEGKRRKIVGFEEGREEGDS